MIILNPIPLLLDYKLETSETCEYICFTQMHMCTPVAVLLVQGVVQFFWLASTVMEVRPPFWIVAAPSLQITIPTVRMQEFSVTKVPTQVRLMVYTT